MEENITCNFLECFYFQIIREKAYSHLENLDQLKNLNIYFVADLLFYIHICFNIFPLSWVHKVTTRTKSFVSVILNVDTWLRTRAIFDQVNIRLIWQWINSISSVLRKLPIHFNGTIISTTFVLLSPILPVICCLKLQQNTVIVIRREINDIFILSKVASSL